MKHSFNILMAWACALLVWAACANPGSGPDGGPYDETPPRIVDMTPPQSLQSGKGTKITLTFSELIKVENTSEKVIVSPPQTEQPVIKASGRRVTVQLLDSIRKGTTYTIDFSDAIEDATEGNPLGHFTYIFSTGEQTDTMEVAGHVLNAADLEPLKGILVGLHASDADTAFTHLPFDRVARTDATGYFSIKGVAADKDYSVYALQDRDGDFRFSQKAEQIGFLEKRIRPSSFPDVRHDTLWVDSVRYDSIRTVPFTHFMPDDLVVLAFQEARQPRYFLKSQRDVPECFRIFFTAQSEHVPTIKGLNFNAEEAFIENRNRTNDTITYWLSDTTLLSLDTLQMAYTYETWDDSLQATYLRTDTLELAPRLTVAKREKQKAEEMEKWQKQLEKRHKKGDYSQEEPPKEYLTLQAKAPQPMSPDKNIMWAFSEPLARLDTTGVHLLLGPDSAQVEAPYELEPLPYDVLAIEMRGEWRPDQEYVLRIDSAALQGIYGHHNNKFEQRFRIAKNEEFGTLFLTLPGADSTAIVQMLGKDGKVVRELRISDGCANFYYVKPGPYYLRCFYDRNADGVWTPGTYAGRIRAEEVFYYPTEIEIRANWDYDQTWNVNALPLTKQKPSSLIKQKEEKKKTSAHERNLERLREKGVSQ